jgi:hypothetical protein
MIPRSSSNREMEEKTIRKDDLIRLLADLTGSCQVVAPVRKGDSLVFEKILSADGVHLSDGNTKKSVKEVFFPQRERLFAYREQETREPSFPGEERVIFGVRPCDARSLSLLDPVFDGDDFKDPYYCSKRENTTVIAIGCSHPMGTCFCTDTGGDPFSLEGADVLLIDMEETYFARPITQRGEEFIRGRAGFEEAAQDQRQLKDEIIEKARESMGSNLDAERVKSVLDGDFWVAGCAPFCAPPVTASTFSMKVTADKERGSGSGTPACFRSSPCMLPAPIPGPEAKRE